VQSAVWSKDLRVTADGTGVVSHVGIALLRMLADRAGLTGALSAALARQTPTNCSPSGFWGRPVRVGANPASPCVRFGWEQSDVGGGQPQPLPDQGRGQGLSRVDRGHGG
jgi:hypothetical protein